MANNRPHPTIKPFYAWLLLLLLTAVGLRLFALTDFPPGLTHDEVAHGLTAQAILQGEHAFYFSIGHGREPLYDYATALLMAAIGPTYLAPRLTAVYSSLLLIAAITAWSRRTFGWQTAVYTAAGLALSFWPLMSARQSLRSIMLPLLFTLAVYFFWAGHTPTNRRWLPFALAGLFCGLSFYSYIPARVIWLLFPASAAYAWLIGRWQPTDLRPKQRDLWLMLAVAALIALPLFGYLAANPQAEIRIRELSSPLTAVAQGDLMPLWHNLRSGLAIIAWQGDDFWRYNIPARPLLSPIMALLFAIGWLLTSKWAIWRPWQQPARAQAAFLAMLWFLLGLSPSLITGAHLSSTQAIAMQPVLFLFPAIGLHQLGLQLGRWFGRQGHRLALGLTLLLFTTTAVATHHAYFSVWGTAPEVRVQYESATTAVLRYLQQQQATDAAIATITPSRLHSPALAPLILPANKLNLRWFDGRSALLIPFATDARLVTSGFASLPPGLQPFLPGPAIAQIDQPASDLDQPLLVYAIDGQAWLAQHQADFVTTSGSQFGQAVELIGYQLTPATAVAPGQSVQLLTLWRLQQAQPDLRLFSHLSNEAGQLIAQADQLAAPSDLWQTGDLLLQHHEISLPSDALVGQYSLTIGWYSCLDATCAQTERLPVFVDCQPIGDNLYLQHLSLTHE